MPEQNPLLAATIALDFQEMERLVRQGIRCDDAFLSDQGSTLSQGEENYSKILGQVSQERGQAIENEAQLLFEIYEVLINAGHRPPDGSNRRCLVRVIAGADPTRHERATMLMSTCLDRGMLDWRNSQWAIEREKGREKDTSSWAYATSPLGRPDELYSDAMSKAAEAGNLAMLKVLARALPDDLHARKNMMCASGVPMHKAVAGGDIDCLKYLLTLLPQPMWGLAPFAKEVTLPAMAAANGREPMLRWLVTQGFEINAHSEGTMKNILSVALEARHPEMVPVLLELGADPSDIPDDSPSPLHVAIWHQSNDVIELLIQAGAPIHHKDQAHMTPLLMAGMVGSAPAAQALITAGADVEARDHEGMTPLYWAARNERIEAFDVLLAAGARVDVVCNNGNSLVSMAKGSIVPRLAQRDREQMNINTTPTHKPDKTLPRI